MTINTPERDEAYVAFAETLPTYLAYSPQLHLVKIGFSSNVRQRLQTIPSDRHEAGKVVLVGWAFGGPRLEAELHDMFERAHESREWFHPVPEMADFIEEEGEEGEPPVCVGDFRVSTRGYWAARRRLAVTEMRDEVVVDFGDGRSLRTRVHVPSVELAESIASRVGVSA